MVVRPSLCGALILLRFNHLWPNLVRWFEQEIRYRRSPKGNRDWLRNSAAPNAGRPKRQKNRRQCNEERRQTFTRARRGLSALALPFAAVLLARLEGPCLVETYAASMPFCSRVSMMRAAPVLARCWMLSPRSARSSKWIAAPVFECAILVARLGFGSSFQLQKRPRKIIVAIPGCGASKRRQ